MTRLAVLSDIHGNLPALEAVNKDMAQFEVDHVVVAGDSVNVGPFSREVLEFVNERNWALIRGNNAFYALDYQTPRMPAHWSAFTLPPWLRDQLGAKWINFLACLPDTISLRFADAAPIRVFHGIPDNPWVAIPPISTAAEVETWLSGTPEKTHIGGPSP
ncbi:MAG: metallophosphoesterase, partial [Chloroflexi bacterium]|nr:metallophosphoesterase [Chloroflexota bacterium]